MIPDPFYKQMETNYAKGQEILNGDIESIESIKLIILLTEM